MRFLFLYLVGLFLTVSLFAQKTDHLVIPPFQQAFVRKPQFPLKTENMIYSDSLIFLAKENIQRYSAARAIKENMLQAADKWLTFSDEELTVLMANARVPRAFDISAKGCPVHGDAVFKVGGSYPWIVDLKHPFQVKCPIDGQVFPSNDYAAYYKSDFSDKKEWDTDYTDDGWGWVSPEGERYWFVAYANHWIWYNHIIPGILHLAQAYLLTGDSRYASQAAFMLYRMASVYPSMNHEDQSRYGLMMKSRGERYAGKIVNRIWETNVIERAAEAYDLVWNAIDADLSLQKRTGKTGEELRAFIEANLLEEGLNAFDDGKIIANFGRHQSALITLHLSRQHAGKEKAFDKMLYESSSQTLNNGLTYAIYNQVFRDGIPFESPGYNAGWITSFMEIAEKLPASYKGLFANFRFKQILDAPLDMVAIGKYTPDIGDGGSVRGGLLARSSAIYHPAYDLYRDPRYLPWLNLSGEKSFTSFQSLFRRPLPDFPVLKNQRAVDVQPSRLFAGYGFGILNNRADEAAVAFTYDIHYAHDHWDYLNIELFANGQKMMPDLGYPDAMNTFVPEVYTWSVNTVSHNTVVVDEKRQQRKRPGMLHDFADGGFARTMDASSPAYENTSEYRRNIIMVDAENGQSYVVDFFNVSGGKRHDYSLHGPPGKTYFPDNEWSDILPGTFAGPTVEPGHLYDDERRLLQGKEIGYSGYSGSGFQHLMNVRQLKTGKGVLEYRHIADEDARLRIFPLSAEGQETFIADAYDKPRAKDNLLKYMICTRKTDRDEPLKSTFVSVFEPYKGEKHILADAQLSKPDRGNGHVVVVERGDRTDVIIYDPSGSTKKINRYRLQTDAVSTVVTFDTSGKLTRVFFSCGSYLQCRGKKFTAEPVRGKVTSVDALQRTFRVAIEGSGKIPEKDFTGRTAHFTNAFRTTVHPLSSVSIAHQTANIQVKDDLLTGRFRVVKVDGNTVITDTSLPFHQHYRGATMLDQNYHPLVLLTELNNGNLKIKEPVASPLKSGDAVWICNIGVGDQFLIKPVFSWEGTSIKKNKNK